MTREQAIDAVHNHDLLIRLDPEFASYEETPEAGSDASTKYYRITDHMHNLPAGLWDSTVTFDAEMKDIQNGVEWTIRAPLGLVQLTYWTIEDATENDIIALGPGEGTKAELCLVEVVTISASRLLLGYVTGKCEGNYTGIHKRFVEKLLSQESK